MNTDPGHILDTNDPEFSKIRFSMYFSIILIFPLPLLQNNKQIFTIFYMGRIWSKGEVIRIFGQDLHLQISFINFKLLLHPTVRVYKRAAENIVEKYEPSLVVG